MVFSSLIFKKMSFSLECLFLWSEEAILNDSLWHRLHSELTGVSFDKGLSSLSLPGLVGSRVSEDGKTYWVCAAEPRRHWQGTDLKRVFWECSLIRCLLEWPETT